MKSKVVLALLLAGVALGVDAGQLYKWVDSSGKVHYTDQPGPGDAAGKPLNVDASPAPVADAPKAPAQSLAEKDREARKRKAAEAEAQAKKDKAEADKKQKEYNCLRARESQRTLQLGGRLSQYDDAGQLVVMDDEARQRAMVDAQKSVDSWCK